MIFLFLLLPKDFSPILLSWQSFLSVNKYARQFNILQETEVKDFFFFFISQRFEIAQSFRYSISTESSLLFESQPSVQRVVYQFVTSLEILAENCENYVRVNLVFSLRGPLLSGCCWVRSLTLNREQLDWRIWCQKAATPPLPSTSTSPSGRKLHPNHRKHCKCSHPKTSN